MRATTKPRRVEKRKICKRERNVHGISSISFYSCSLSFLLVWVGLVLKWSYHTQKLELVKELRWTGAVVEHNHVLAWCIKYAIIADHC